MAKDGSSWHVYFKSGEAIEPGDEVVVTVEQLQTLFKVEAIGPSENPDFTLICFEGGGKKL